MLAFLPPYKGFILCLSFKIEDDAKPSPRHHSDETKALSPRGLSIAKKMRMERFKTLILPKEAGAFHPTPHSYPKNCSVVREKTKDLMPPCVPPPSENARNSEKNPVESSHGDRYEQAQGKSLGAAETFIERSVGGSRSTLPGERRARRDRERFALVGWARKNGKLFRESPLEQEGRVTRHGEHNVAITPHSNQKAHFFCLARWRF